MKASRRLLLPKKWTRGGRKRLNVVTLKAVILGCSRRAFHELPAEQTGGNRRPERDTLPIYLKGETFMAKHLNPLEKEFLIRQYKSNRRVSINEFCEANHLTVPSLKRWMKQYEEGGIEGLARADAEVKAIVPDGFDRTEEAYKREILKLRIENERLKKTMPFR